VAMLWGKSAQEHAHLFQSQFAISSAHPSPLSASRGFLGSKPFTKANEILLAQGGKPIAW
jgi:uracil-DNA glycosylase